MSYNFAEYKIRDAGMGTDFARELAMKWFDWTEDDLDDYCGLDLKGRHKGKIHWLTVTKGGWHGGVVSKGMKCIALVVDEKLVAFAGRSKSDNIFKTFSQEALYFLHWEYETDSSRKYIEKMRKEEEEKIKLAEEKKKLNPVKLANELLDVKKCQTTFGMDFNEDKRYILNLLFPPHDDCKKNLIKLITTSDSWTVEEGVKLIYGSEGFDKILFLNKLNKYILK